MNAQEEKEYTKEHKEYTQENKEKTQEHNAHTHEHKEETNKMCFVLFRLNKHFFKNISELLFTNA